MEITYSYKNLIEELSDCKNKKKYLINAKNYIIDEKKKDYYEPNDFKDLNFPVINSCYLISI